MARAKVDANGGHESVEQHLEAAEQHVENGAAPEMADADAEDENRSDIVATVTTVAVVGVGAAVFEAALLPGLVLGVAAMWLPQYFPKMGEALNPLVRSTVRGAYKLTHKTREMMAEAQEQFHDIAAEVHAEGDAAPMAKAATVN
jgi:hypothetical protein